MPPFRVEYGKPLIVPTRRVCAMEALELPLITSGKQKGDRPVSIGLTFVPKPNTYRAPMGTQPYSEGRLFTPEIVRDQQPVPGSRGHDRGITSYDYRPVGGVPNGAYVVLPDGSWQALCTSGIALERRSYSAGELAEDIGYAVTVALQGGSVPVAYLPELRFLEVSGQSETGDDGPGESRVYATATLAKASPNTGESVWGATAAQATMTETRGLDCSPTQVQTVPSGRTCCFPRQAITWWPAQERDKYDTTPSA